MQKYIISYPHASKQNVKQLHQKLNISNTAKDFILNHKLKSAGIKAWLRWQHEQAQACAIHNVLSWLIYHVYRQIYALLLSSLDIWLLGATGTELDSIKSGYSTNQNWNQIFGTSKNMNNEHIVSVTTSLPSLVDWLLANSLWYNTSSELFVSTFSKFCLSMISRQLRIWLITWPANWQQIN